jgi:hypothetical protein
MDLSLSFRHRFRLCFDHLVHGGVRCRGSTASTALHAAMIPTYPHADRQHKRRCTGSVSSLSSDQAVAGSGACTVGTTSVGPVAVDGQKFDRLPFGVEAVLPDPVG